MEYQQVIATLTPDTYKNLKRAIELGKWPDGKRLSAEQKEHAMAAVIAWDQMYQEPGERVGDIDKKHKEGDLCDDSLETPLTWKN